MGWDITTIGRHHLDIRDVQTVARHLSEALDINIDYGYDREYLYSEEDNTIRSSNKYSWVSLGRFMRRQEDVLYRLSDEYFCARAILSECAAKGIQPIIEDDVWFEAGENKVSFSLECMSDNDRGIFYLNIYDEMFCVNLCDDPGRWFGFYHFFDESDYTRHDQDRLKDFREQLRWVAEAMGCGFVYLFSDQGPTEFIPRDEHSKWSDIEEYILSLRWIDDYYDNEIKQGYPDNREYARSVFRLMDIPEFLRSKNPVRANYSSDVFRDDFSDLE